VTSPPYFGLRDYSGGAAEIGKEKTPAEFVAALVAVFREVRRVLRDDGTLWLNLGSSYASGDKTPNQSLLRQRVPSCGKRGTAPQGSQGADRACLDSCDEPQGATHCHHESSARTGQSSRQAAQQIEPTTQGSEHSGFDQSSRLTFQTGDHQSTTGATSQNVQDALLLSDEALVCQQEPRTSLRDAQECADKSACTCGTSRMLQPLAVHTKGKESFFSACRRSDCNGIGMCGYCFSSLTTASLNIKQKDELNIPHLVAMALQADGWILRQTICWSKPNPMPESVRDRCTKAHEYVFLLSKSERYFFDSEAMKEPASQPRGEAKKTGQHKSEVFGHSGTLGSNQGAGTRNRRSVWTVSTKPYKGAHFATFPTELIEPCILAGAPAGGIVLDPFFGSGTTGQVAQALGRQFIGIELNDAYKPLQDERLRQPSLLLEAA
jgi:DNA modification methylase